MPISARSIPLGSRFPWFSIADTSGRVWTSESFPASAPVLIAFLCNHSPYVRHIESTVSAVLNGYLDSGVGVLAISPNDVNSYPSDNDAMTIAQAERAGFRFPYAVDHEQSVAKAFMASCTPEFYIYDRDRRLVYHGQFDSSRPNNSEPVTGRDLIAAMDATLLMDLVPAEQAPSFGCSVKWTPGREPDYVFSHA